MEGNETCRFLEFKSRVLRVGASRKCTPRYASLAIRILFELIRMRKSRDYRSSGNSRSYPFVPSLKPQIPISLLRSGWYMSQLANCLLSLIFCGAPVHMYIINCFLLICLLLQGGLS